jgi:hypothetical protein
MALSVDDMRQHILEALQVFGFVTPPIHETRAVLYQVTKSVIDHITSDGVGHVLTDVAGSSTGTGIIKGTDGTSMADLVVKNLAETGIIQQIPDQYLGLKALCKGINDELPDARVTWNNINTTAFHDDPTQVQTYIDGLDAQNLRDRIVARMASDGFAIHDPVAMQGLFGLASGIVEEITINGWLRNDVVIGINIDVPGSIN